MYLLSTLTCVILILMGLALLLVMCFVMRRRSRKIKHLQNYAGLGDTKVEDLKDEKSTANFEALIEKTL